MHGSSMEDVAKRMKAGYMAGGGAFSFQGPEMFFERYLFLEKEQGICQIREILDQEGKKVHKGRLWKN